MLSLESIVANISGALEKKNEARDRALVDSRQVIRYAAKAIRALHRNESAREMVDAGRAMAASTKRQLEQYPDLYWTGYVQDAQKELAEACIVEAIIQARELPEPGDIGVELAPYLNGMAEAASEMRRFILDTIRRGDPVELQRAEHVLQIMDDIYTVLLTVDFSDALTGGLRRTTDALRAVLERTRGDLTLTLRQSELQRALLGYKP